MSGEEKTPAIDVYIESVFNPGANVTSTPSYTARIPKVHGKKEEDYEKYYVPKVVSIGPYHFGNRKLKSIQSLKPFYTMKLLDGNTGTRKSLYENLVEAEMVKELRGYYKEGKTSEFNDMDFANMMLLDACFILYCVRSILGGKYEDCPELKNNEIFLIHQDLLLLENQIPYKVLKEVMKLVPGIEWTKKIKSFVYGSILASGKRPTTQLKWLKSLLRARKDQSVPEEKWLKKLIMSESDDQQPYDHLLQLLHRRLTNTLKVETSGSTINMKKVRCNFLNVRELEEVGIHFKPSDPLSSPPHVEFFKSWGWCSAYVELPPITVNDYTKPLLLNLMTYEAGWFFINDAWVTSYVCLLDSLIDDAEDVKVLRKAWVIENSLSSDKEVAKLFNDIGSYVAPSRLAYLETKSKIQSHYESMRNTLFSQLKNEYFKSPWAIFALLGALIALFLSGVQTYFTVWSPESKCDNLCMFLKMNHHL